MKHDYGKARVGVFGIGLDAYWPQFDGLKERLEGYLERVSQKVARDGIEVVNLGLVDSPERAMEAGHQFRRADVDLILLHVTTYALSSTVLPVVRRAKVPVIVLNLQPSKAIDYGKLNAMGDRTRMTGEWLAHCGACPVPEISNVFRRARIRFHEVTGTIDDDPVAWEEIDSWIEAAKAAHIMAHNRMGLLGHYYCGMLDIYTDATLQCAVFGGHMEILEVEELSAIRRNVTEAQIRDKLAEFGEAFEIQSDCSPAELKRAARTSVALDQLVERHRLGSLCYYYEGGGIPEQADTMTSVILGNSLLTGRNIPVAGEYEIKNIQAMKIMDSLGVGGSFSEYYAIDYNEDVVLWGHDGPGHVAIAEGKPKVRPLEVYHGKIGDGLSIEMSVKHGPVTLFSVIDSTPGELKFLVAEAESVPGDIMQIGNTNSRYRFPVGARQFVKEWNRNAPAHHCAIGVGHVANRIEQLGHLLGVETIRVC